MKSSSSDPESGAMYDVLSDYDSEPAVFWRKLCDFASARLGSEGVCLLLQSAGEGSDIRVLAQSPDGAARELAKAGANEALMEVDDSGFVPLSGTHGKRFQGFALPAREGLPALWMIADAIGDHVSDDSKLSLSREIRLLSEMYQARRHSKRTDEKLMSLSEVLDLGLALGESDKFQEAALRACNELAPMVRASRVSIAWLEGGELKLKATSHGGRISANSGEALALQQVMEEATDQDNEVSHPEIAGSLVISREHRLFSSTRENEAVLSIPLRHLSGVVGAVCLERPVEEGKWEPSEVERNRLFADLVAPRLDDLHYRSGWLGRRAWRSLRKRSSGLLGPEHTGWKLTGILLVVTLIALALIRVEHKVRAPFILKTDAAAVISAPFPGYIEQAYYHLGDIVEEGQALVDLDRKELLLEEADNEALRNKNIGEIRRHEAEDNLAQMRVAQAEVAQADARLAIIRHRLDLTRIVAPFYGVVVEGDLRERLSSPVQSGEELLKIVQLTDLFGQLQVDNRDISYLKADSEGELAFASRPGEKFRVIIDRFEPVAEIRPEGAVFLLRVQIPVEAESWWRPGMSGVCKMNAGKRSLLWIGGHRLVETLRLWLWV